MVIVAGGRGSRLWPMSRTTKPKQFFPLLSEDPLLRETALRVVGLCGWEKVFVAVTSEFSQLVRDVLPEIPEKNIIEEPEGRDTGPAMLYAALRLSLEDPHEPTLFLPSDHAIADLSRFLAALRVGDQLVRETGCLVDVGVPPRHPSPALGYTRVGREIVSRDGISVHAFAGHVEKPSLEVAQRYQEDPSYLWHTGYYFWTPEGILRACERHAPEVFANIVLLKEILLTGDAEKILAHYHELPSRAFDYLITEKLCHDEVMIIKGDFGWSDVGTWNALYEQCASEQEMVLRGNVITKETHRSLVYGDGKKLIAVFGMEDVIIVDTPDALVVAHRKVSDRMKELVHEIVLQRGEEHV